MLWSLELLRFYAIGLFCVFLKELCLMKVITEAIDRSEFHGRVEACGLN